MKALFALFLLAGSLFAQQLSVRTATTRKVELKWTHASPGSTVERRSGVAPFEKVGDATADSFVDEKIAPYGTYRYRLHAAGGTLSNEVRVGPPPLGVNAVARVPKGTDPATFGVAAAIADDENGDPSVAFVWVDPDGDRKRDDTAIYFSHWNRATYSWKAPVLVEVVGDIPAKNADPVSLACDSASGNFAVACPKENQNGSRVAISGDAGATWHSTPVATDLDGEISAVAMAEGGGHWFLAINTNRGLRFLNGAVGEDPSKWKSQPAPSGTRIRRRSRLPPTAPATQWRRIWIKPDKGDNDQIPVWSPETGKVTPAADSNEQNCERPGLRLSMVGGATRILMDCDRGPKDDRKGIWYASSTAPGVWSAPVKLPVDGPRSTTSPLALAVDSRGRLGAVYASSSGGGDTACGYPVIARSTNGVNWSACGPGKRAGGDFEKNPSAVGAIYSPDDRLNVLWREEGDSKYGAGVFLWRE